MTKSRWIKWFLRFGMILWPLYWLAQIWWGDLGASPALELNHELGEIALILLSVNLLVGIGMSLFRPAPLWIRFWISERRFWGVLCFLILLAHVFFYFVNEAFEAKAFTQVLTKTYLIFGLSALLILFALALTSNDWSLRKLGGKKWKNLHRSVYLALFLVMGHVMLIEKADLLKFGIWLGALIAFQVLRFFAQDPRRLFK